MGEYPEDPYIRWRSSTRVARISGKDQAEAWRRISLQADAWSNSEAWSWKKPVDSRQVCCFALQNKCFYDHECQFSHDLDQLKVVGCQFGNKCYAGHRQEWGHTSAAWDGSGARPSVDTLQFFRQSGPASHVACCGPSFDDTDPLWQELVFALTGDDEELGDEDLPECVRQRLAAAGQYHLVQEGTSDEWVCLPARYLCEGLKVSSCRLAHARQGWLQDELTEAAALWEQLQDKLPDQHLVRLAADAVRQAVSSRGLGVSSTLMSLRFIHSQSPDWVDDTLWLEMLEKLERCLFVARAAAYCSDHRSSTEPPSVFAREQWPPKFSNASTMSASRESRESREHAVSLFEVVSEAAKHEDFILVHHIVETLSCSDKPLRYR